MGGRARAYLPSSANRSLGCTSLELTTRHGCRARRAAACDFAVNPPRPIARRICCDAQPAEPADQGSQFGLLSLKTDARLGMSIEGGKVHAIALQFESCTREFIRRKAYGFSGTRRR
jgi:hypothetical protein